MNVLRVSSVCGTILFLHATALSVLTMSPLAWAESPYLSFVREIENPDREFNADFGRSVAVSPDGSIIAVSATIADASAVDSGAIYLFDTNGALIRKLNHPDNIENGNLGLDMKWTADDHLIVGSWTPGIDAPVYLFDRQGDLLRRFENPDEATRLQGQFGAAVGTTGNQLLISSGFEDDEQIDAGAVYLFDQSGRQIRRYVSPDQTQRGILGRSIAVLDENTFAVGAYTESHEASETGRVYVFDIDGTVIGTLVNPEPMNRDAFGINVAKVGNNVLVGSIQHGGASSGGMAYLFTPTGELLTTFHNPHPDVRDWFGYSNTSVGDYIVIGSVFEGTTAPLGGAAYVFDQQGALLQELYDPTPGDQGSFGLVFGQGDTLYASASYDGGGPSTRGPGAVYVYKMNLLPGDVDMNGVVNLLDFASLRTHFGQDVDARADGDLTGDLHVDIHDFAQLRANFNRRQAPVPEPGVHVAAWAALLLATWVSGLPGNRRRCEWRQSQ